MTPLRGEEPYECDDRGGRGIWCKDVMTGSGRGSEIRIRGGVRGRTNIRDDERRNLEKKGFRGVGKEKRICTLRKRGKDAAEASGRST